MVASFNRLATMKIIPIIVLGFITFIFKNSLQSYDVMLIPPNFWDILHGNVTNVTFSSYLCDLYETRSYRNDNNKDH